MDADEIRSVLDTLQANEKLEVETNLDGRAEALDTLRFLREGIHFLPDHRAKIALAAQADALQRRWERIDQGVFGTVRALIQSGEWRGARLRRELSRYTDYDGAARQAHYDFDGLDVLTAGLFLSEPAPSETRERTNEMIHLEPTPACALLELVDRVPMDGRSPLANDVFYDLGSGLGQAAILVHLLSGVRAKGVEVQPAFCQYAQRSAERFALSGVEFVCADARDLAYEDGTVFYMFTPFTGSLLRVVLERLHRVAKDHPITLCTLGPCTPIVSQQSWLYSIDAVDDIEHEFKLAIFESR
ncbi:MAG: class I SAM-dependent methyltransferase [Anaerolineae bacterium]|nr:class I SAM-dependent methyltransferase [Anaerolineae bacterium]